MADTDVRGVLYGVSAVNVIIYRRLSSLGGGWQVETESFTSEYLSGKSVSTLKVGREISRKLHIDANIVLGV